MSKKYDDYLKTDYWKRVSDAVKAKAGYRCQLCNSQHDLAAHHRTYDHRGRELEFIDDLTCLCRRCHALFHGVVKPLAETRKPEAYSSKSSRAIRSIDPEAVLAAVPPGAGPVQLTHELVQRCRTARGAFTNSTLRAFGLKAPLSAGWPSRLVGTTVSREVFKQAVEGRYVYNSGKLV